MADSKQVAAELKLNRSGFSVLMSQVKAVQGAHTLYKHFRDEVKTFRQQIKEIQKGNEEISLPKYCDAVSLAQGFYELFCQPHPYPHHIKDIMENLQANTSPYLQVSVLERFLHSMDKIDPNFYENPEHKQEVKQVIIQTLEDLYDEIEELEEEEEDYDDEDYLIEDEE